MGWGMDWRNNSKEKSNFFKIYLQYLQYNIICKIDLLCTAQNKDWQNILILNRQKVNCKMMKHFGITYGRLIRLKILKTLSVIISFLFD